MHSGVWVFERYRVVGESFEAVLDSCYRLMMLTSSLRDILFNTQQLCGPNFMVLGDPRFISLHLCDHVEFLVIFMRHLVSKQDSIYDPVKCRREPKGPRNYTKNKEQSIMTRPAQLMFIIYAYRQ
ncbi:unnamed protein product, partial [Vitis vinifera]